MSVLIRGMEMPSCCMFCPISNNVGCGLTNPPIIMTSKEMLAGRPDWCPLVPVPEPHGRLGDLDALMGRIEHDTPLSSTFEKIVRRYIEKAPTVIPAEEARHD